MRRILGVFLAVLAVSAVAAGTASACNPNRSNDHNTYEAGWDVPGYVTPAGCIFGASADIYTTNPTIVAPDWDSQSFSAPWVGVRFKPANGTTVEGQLGWENLYGGGGENWAAINTGGNDWKTGNWARPANGSTNNYKVTYSWANQTFHFFYNGVNYFNWQYTTQVGCNYSTFGDIVSEIDTFANQMPGTAGNHEVFQNVQTMSNGGTWVTPPLFDFAATNPAPNHFSLNKFGSEFDSWDQCQ